MSKVKASVIIPTHNRHDKLAETLAGLKQQQLEKTEYEIIVVDDGSAPPVVVGESEQGPAIKLERTEGVERSAARNRGAAIASGERLIFVDDDASVDSDFVAAHLRAHAEWPEALVVGSVNLPEEAMTKPFARFRQRLERQGLPLRRGPIETRNFCTASNMSISLDRLKDLGGFDATIVSGEDQDLALRYTAQGARIVFIPEADVIHRDDALDIRSYCRRAEWGSLRMIPFCQRYPALPENIERERVNGRMHIGREPVLLSLRKLVKRILAAKLIVEVEFAIASLLERLAPTGRALDRVYRLLLGAHILRGYRKGLKLSAARDRQLGMEPKLAAGSYLEADR
jgi:GT2 family glycosyltransferase